MIGTLRVVGCRVLVVAVMLLAVAPVSAAGATAPSVALSSVREYHLEETNIADGVSADFNNDGLNDLVFSGFPSSGGGDMGAILLNRGAGRFLKPRSFASNLFALAAADVNDDGNVDLIGTVPFDGIAVQLGNGDGTFEAPDLVYPSQVHSLVIAVADFDQDGAVDVATGVVDTGADTIEPVVLFGTGTGDFGNAVSLDAPLSDDDLEFAGLTAADVNGDGWIDVVIGGATAVRVYLNLEGRTFAAPVLYSAGAGINHVEVGDVTGDGVVDIVVTNEDGSQTLSLLPGIGGGQFGSPTTLGPLPELAADLALRDMNGDGIDDIIVKLYGVENSLAISKLGGRGRLAFDYYSGFGSGGGVLLVDHYNPGVRPDIAVGSLANNVVSVRLNRTPAQTSP